MYRWNDMKFIASNAALFGILGRTGISGIGRKETVITLVGERRVVIRGLIRNNNNLKAVAGFARVLRDVINTSGKRLRFVIILILDKNTG